jgi:hypothetical protein
VPWEVTHHPEERFIRLVIEGPHRFCDVREMCVELFAVAKIQENWSLLIDTRASVAQLSILDVYRMPKLFMSLGLQRDSRVALLFSGASPEKRTFSFVGTVSKNQGFNVNLFCDHDEAVDWLRSC